MASTGQDFEFFQRSRAQITIAVKSTAGVPLDLSTATVITWDMFTDSRGSGTSLAQKTLAGGDITVVNADSTNDGARFTLTTTETMISPGSYPHELRVVTPNIDEPVTLGHGRCLRSFTAPGST
jgi:hypothetical protein